MITCPTTGVESSTVLSTDASRLSNTVMSADEKSFDGSVSFSFTFVIVAVLVIVLPPWPTSTVAVIVRVSD